MNSRTQKRSQSRVFCKRDNSSNLLLQMNRQQLVSLKETKEGFALLEVLLAASLLAIGLFAVIDALNRCVAAARSVHTATISNVLLANKAYEFRVEQSTDYLDQDGEFPDYPGYVWTRTLESAAIGELETEGLFKQTVTVSWQERGRTVSESIVEYRYLPEAER